MAISIEEIATSIASISVEGLQIMDLDNIPETSEVGRGPIVIPNPDGYWNNLVVERASLGNLVRNVTYDLMYRLLSSEVGEGRVSIFDNYKPMVLQTALFVGAVLTNDAITGLIDLQLGGISNFGPVTDPSDNLFHGCDFILRVLEFEDV